MDTVIQVDNLKKTYPQGGGGRFEALKGISFKVERGEIFGLLGPNGAGKTTTLETLECLRRQDSGTVQVFGLDNLQHPEAIRQRIGVQLQSSAYLPYLTLTELLALFGSLYGLRAKTAELLALVHLTEKAHERCQNLSGGQLQRFAIACALVNEPDIIFLDEPTTGLDPQARRQLWQVIRDLNRAGKTILLTTHYMEEAEYLCHRVGIVDQGTLLAISEPRRLIDQLAHTTQISFLTDHDLPEQVFGGMANVQKVFRSYPKVIVEISNLDSIAPVVERLKREKIPFYGFTVKTASLEDVYLDLTGKEYEP